LGGAHVFAPLGPAQCAGCAHSLLEVQGPLAFRGWHVPFAPLPPSAVMAQ
jgi:hypothetical protein